jgi:hypothetical protein
MTESWNTPEIIELRKGIRACLLAGHSFNMLKDVLAAEDGRLEHELKAAGTPRPECVGWPDDWLTPPEPGDDLDQAKHINS